MSPTSNASPQCKRYSWPAAIGGNSDPARGLLHGFSKGVVS